MPVLILLESCLTKYILMQESTTCVSRQHTLTYNYVNFYNIIYNWTECCELRAWYYLKDSWSAYFTELNRVTGDFCWEWRINWNVSNWCLL